MSKTALLIVDMQRGGREASSCKHIFDKAVWCINDLSKLFRAKNLPVVVIQHLEIGGEKNEWFDNVDGLVVGEKDYRIVKNFFNSFWKTELDEILKQENVDSVIVCGFAAEYCVMATCNGALERGYQMFVLQNGIAGFAEEGINVLQSTRPLISLEAIKYFLKD